MLRFAVIIAMAVGGCYPDWRALEDNVKASGDGDGDGDAPGGDGDGDASGDGDGTSPGDGDGDFGNGDGDGDIGPDPGPACGNCPDGNAGPSCCTQWTDVDNGVADDAGLCGQDLGTSGIMGAAGCWELDRQGSPNSACPPSNMAGIIWPGCCLSNGLCGLRIDELQLGCAPLSDGGAAFACDPVNDPCANCADDETCIDGTCRYLNVDQQCADNFGAQGHSVECAQCMCDYDQGCVYETQRCLEDSLCMEASACAMDSDCSGDCCVCGGTCADVGGIGDGPCVDEFARAAGFNGGQPNQLQQLSILCMPGAGTPCAFATETANCMQDRCAGVCNAPSACF